MSKDNWEKCVFAGVTGIDTPTCLPAALDMLSKHTSVSLETYLEYMAGWFDEKEEGKSYKRVKKVFGRLLTDLTGSSRVKNIAYRRATTIEETEQVLDKARQGGKRVCITDKDNHAVGLRPVKNGWKIEGHTTLDKSSVYTAEDIHALLSKKRDQFKGKGANNIYLFPSEPKKRRR